LTRPVTAVTSEVICAGDLGLQRGAPAVGQPVEDVEGAGGVGLRVGGGLGRGHQDDDRAVEPPAEGAGLGQRPLGVPQRPGDQPAHQVALEAQLDRVHGLLADHRERRDHRGPLEQGAGADEQRPGPVDGDQPAVPLVAGHDRRDRVLPHPAGQLVVPGHEQDAVGRGQVGVGEHVGRGDDGLVGAQAREPAGRRHHRHLVLGLGVQQPQPVADLGDVLGRAGAGDDLAVRSQAQHGGALEGVGELLGDLGQPTAAERDVDELVMHAAGEHQRLALLADDGAEHLGDDLAHPHRRGQGEHRQRPAVGLGQHVGRHRRRPLGLAVGQRRGAHGVQPLHQGAAVGGVGRRQARPQDDEDVGTGHGQGVGGVVDHHVADDAVEAAVPGDDLRPREAGQSQRLGQAQAHALLPTGPLAAALGHRRLRCRQVTPG
jgi:hypothetical protein